MAIIARSDALKFLGRIGDGGFLGTGGSIRGGTAGGTVGIIGAWGPSISWVTGRLPHRFGCDSRSPMQPD